MLKTNFNNTFLKKTLGLLPTDIHHVVINTLQLHPLEEKVLVLFSVQTVCMISVVFIKLIVKLKTKEIVK